MISSRFVSCAAVAAALVLGLGQAAKADLFVLGSDYTIDGTDPATGASFSSTVTLTPGSSQSVDGGAINLNFSIDDVSGQGEWLVFDYTTVSGEPLSVASDDWSMYETGLDAAVPLNFDAAFVEFSLNGADQSPTANIFGNYSIETSPVPGLSGTGLGGNGFADTTIGGPGPLPELGTYVDPFSYLEDTGITDTVNGYTEALLFYPDSPTVPEPPSAILLLPALLALSFAIRKRTALGQQ